ncbi:precorrin-2 C(20)-methyltransferase [Chitinophaga varians]|uniref:precorrin-2 C(20)-methyltransferase n=1 Tax=Chitinophaga varians TaxID=2202339 RepID=UPI00165F0D2F|nr:precorrin-2 C(20)-methyltransferase [Chitinophaga varians]MBC9908975.1 precorrin-2 C(20)-methyltransferase [Chitinophaga varians]
MSTTGKIYAVSLGPGDPELITVKGLKVLKTCDVIFYPASLQEEGVRSYARSILDYYDLGDKRMVPVVLDMKTDRAYNLEVYTQCFFEMKALVETGAQVCFVSEGDVSFYSTFVYLLQQIHVHQLPLEIIAGVPSFLLATAAHQAPLALLREKIAIIPLLKSEADLQRYLQQFETVVLIKVRAAMQYIQPLVATGKATMLYSEKLGTPDQQLFTDVSALEGHVLPYFSLIILKSNLCA